MSTVLDGDLLDVVAAAAAGDEIAFARIIAAHDDDLARVAYLIAGDVSIAQEAVAAAWEIAWRRLRSLRDHERLRAWLVAIAANEARQLLRKTRRRSVVEIAVETIDGSDHRFAGATTGQGRDQHLDLVAALQRLSPEDREIIAMRYALGLSSFEIAAATGRSAPGVRSRIARALGRLREDLGDD